MVKNRLGCLWSEFQMGSEIRKPNCLKSGQKCPDFEFSGFEMFGTIAIAIANRTV